MLTAPVLKGNITPATLTVTGGITAQSRAYDGTTNATLITGTLSTTGLVSGDVASFNLTGLTGRVTDKNVNLNKKFQEDPATSTVTFAKTFGFVSQILGFPSPPRLFLLKDVSGGLSYIAGDSPASVAGNSLLSGPLPQDLAFIVGHHLAYYRDEHYLAKVFQTSAELKSALLGAVRVAGVSPAGDPNIEATAQAIAQRLEPRETENLRAACKLFVEAGAKTDLKQWLQAVELTACRTGLLVCGDLDVAARMIEALPPAGPTDLPPRDKIKDLVLFSVSDEYFRLREAIGITINIG